MSNKRTFEPNYKVKRINDGYNYGLTVYEFDQFNSEMLDLGDIAVESESNDALAAVFDLEGFTSFCSQIDPQLVIAKYLNEFLDWLFLSISEAFVQKRVRGHIVLWGKLPFYAKFMGDGVLFLWNTRGLDPEMIGNIVMILLTVCEKYKTDFLPAISVKVSGAPIKLRCGIARGQIFSVGEAKDFVGPCINAAARLQKLMQFSFSFAQRGFYLEEYFTETAQKEFILIKAPIRGIGKEERAYVLKSEFKTLPLNKSKKLSI